MHELIEWRDFVKAAKDEVPHPEVSDYQQTKNAEDMKS